MYTIQKGRGSITGSELTNISYTIERGTLYCLNMKYASSRGYAVPGLASGIVGLASGIVDGGTAHVPLSQQYNACYSTNC
jgi:hypothetical protein